MGIIRQRYDFQYYFLAKVLKIGQYAQYRYFQYTLFLSLDSLWTKCLFETLIPKLSGSRFRVQARSGLPTGL